MQAWSIRRGPSSSSLSADPQGGRQAPLTFERMVSGRTKAHEPERLLPWKWKVERLAAVAA